MSPRAPWLTVLAFAAAGCANDISAQSAAAGRAIVTYRAPGASFEPGATFAIVTKVVLVSDAGTVRSVDAPSLVALAASELEGRGFRKVAEVDPAGPVPAAPLAADLSVNVTALESSQTTPQFWVGSPAYLEPAAWGYSGYAWHAPWNEVAIPYTGGTLLVELGDLAHAGAAGPSQVTLLWTAVCYGASTESGQYDGSAALAAVSQAFAQSPYLRPGGVIP